jgi:CO/xanthine dehydrogenase Mo-binding subunit
VTPVMGKPALPGSLDGNRRLSQWLEFRADSRVTIRTGKVEIGQGILTALAQIAADELDVAFWRVEVKPAATDVGPDEGVTSGSRSVSDSGRALRYACAAARALVLSVVAQRTGVPLGSIAVVDGAFIGPNGQIGSYWEAAGQQLLECEAPGHVSEKPWSARRVAGQAAARGDLPDKLFGVPRYLHDIRLPGMKFARILRPVSRGARLLDKPVTTPGVAIVVDGSFLAVVCDSEEAADAAAASLRQRLCWEERDTLPDETSLPDYLRAAPSETTLTVDRPGEAAASETFSAEFFRPYLAHASIGLCCAVAQFDAGNLKVWSHSQSIFSLRNDIAKTMNLPRDHVVVQHCEGAGCYGHNGADDVALDACLVARAFPGKPVRVQWSREDELARGPLASAMLVTVEAGIGPSGTIVSWRQDIISGGHMTRPGSFTTPSLLAASELAAPFELPVAINPPLSSGGGADRNAIPIYRTGGQCVAVHRLTEMPLRTSSLRGLGAMINVLAIESVMDELALAARCDPIAYRLAHLDDPRARDVIEAAMAMEARAGARRDDGVGRGFGFARYKGTGAYCGVVAEIEARNQVVVRRLWIAVDAGEVINPEGARHQIEGGAIQSCSFALKEAVGFDRRGVTSSTWEHYPILRFSEVPEVEVDLLTRSDMPPMGVGECSVGPTVAAVSSAIYDALGVRARTMPFTADQLAADVA